MKKGLIRVDSVEGMYDSSVDIGCVCRVPQWSVVNSCPKSHCRVSAEISVGALGSRPIESEPHPMEDQSSAILYHHLWMTL